MSPSPRTLVITGASSGINRTTARPFAAAGFTNAFAARRQAAAEEMLGAEARPRAVALRRPSAAGRFRPLDAPCAHLPRAARTGGGARSR